MFTAQNIASGNVRTRSLDFGIELKVWGWQDGDFERHLPLLDDISNYVSSAFQMGLPEDDMVDDIIEHFGAMFEDADIQISDNDQIEVMLVPVGADLDDE